MLNNVYLHLGHAVTKAEPIESKGYKLTHYSVNNQDEKEFLAQYVINAAWDESPYLTYQASGSATNSILNQPPTKIYLRTIGLYDVSKCRGIPKDQSYFGLLGEAGGMVSFFSSAVAMIYVPEDGLSYQGLYDLIKERHFWKKPLELV